jgi:hypothetical protein
MRLEEAWSQAFRIDLPLDKSTTGHAKLDRLLTREFQVRMIALQNHGAVGDICSVVPLPREHAIGR